MPAACLPATGPDQLLILLLLGVAALLIAAGIFAVRSAKGRIATLALVPLILLGVAASAPASPAQALETAIPNFSFSDSWTVNGNVTVWSATSENAAGQALADMDTLEDMVVAGTATKSSSLVASTAPNNTYQFQTVPGSFDDFDFSYVVPGAGGGSNSLSTAFDLLEDSTDVSVVLTFTYNYKDQCNRPLQTVVTYTGSVTAPQPVP